MKNVILFVVCLCSWYTAQAQLPPACSPGQPPADDCFDACIYCNFNGITSSTNNYTAGGAPGFCGSIENEQWLGFIAGANTATFTATAINCSNGDGIQIALYADCSDNPIDCNSGQDNGANIPVELVNVPLTPGTNYYLLVDGFGGDQCTFNITVDPPQAVVPPALPGSIGPIQGPINVCPGAVITYSIPPAANAGAYTWTVPNGWLINGSASPQQILASDGGNSVQITVGNSNGQICVSAQNSCQPNGPSTCRNIIVAPIPPTILAPIIICNEDAPYTLPWGESAPSSGNYQATLESYLGCDSVVRQQVTIKAPIITALTLKTICSGDAVSICGVDYTESGSFSHLCESFQGCDSLVTFSISVLDPVAEINGGGVLTCNNTSVVLTATPSPGLTFFTWKNGQGNVIGNGNSFSVTTPGTYILSASLSSAGVQCIKSDTIEITGNTQAPSLLASGGALNCVQTSVQLNALSNASPAGWLWSGPSGFSASIPNPTATLLGNYTVTVTNGATGCTASTTVVVSSDTAPPDITPFGTTLTCVITSAQITAQVVPNAASFVWSGPGNFTATEQTPTVFAPGNYIVTVTNTINGCTGSATAVVGLNDTPPGATASASGVISCNAPQITLTGGPGNAGNTFTWSGPANFTATGATTTAALAGTYQVVVRGGNGCTSTAAVLVSGDVTPPDVVATGDTLNCAETAGIITGFSATNGATFAWNGPAGFTSNLPSPAVTTPGDYILTVTGTNACTNTATATVTGDFSAPDVTATGGNITCSQSSTTISGNSTTNGATLQWSGPGGFASNLPVVTVNTVGDYTLTATANNGCTATAVAVVAPDANVPNASATGDMLTCTVNSVVIDGNTTSSNVTLAWSGPNGFQSTEEDPQVNTAGVYVLTVTDTLNGCTAQAAATITLDDISPVVSVQTDTITCASPQVTLEGTANTGNVSWLWTGPANFQSNQQNPESSLPGVYDVLITNLQNGCTATASTTVTLNQQLPQISSSNGVLTCSVDTLVLQANADLASDFTWSGPGGFSFVGATTMVVLPGDYVLIGAALENGCADTLVVNVSQNILPPGATATGDTITCALPAVVVQAQSPAALTYMWSGPAGFSASEQNPTVMAGGVYTVTVTGANGCTSTAEAEVALNTSTAVVLAVANDFITCFAPSVNIQTNVSTSSPVVSTIWSGPNNYTSTDEDALVFNGGLYALVVTTANGCTSVLEVNVQEDTNLPDIQVIGGVLTCSDTSLVLTAPSQTLGLLYDWSGPGNFSSTDAAPEISTGGVYALEVTAQNGCTSSAQALVTVDVTPPDASSAVSDVLDCAVQAVIVTGSSNTSNITFEWTGPNNFSADTPEATVDLPGQYTLLVTGSNGCTSTSNIEVLQDVQDPDANALGGVVDCISGQLNLSGLSNTTGATFGWTGPNNFTSVQQNPTVSTPGLYILTVTGANGCTALANATVSENTDAPVVALDGAGLLTCLVTDLTLESVIATAGATGVWTGPNNFTANTANITVNTPGEYTFTVTALNGCIAAPSLTVLQNIDLPEAVTATGGLLNCSFPSINLAASSLSEVTYLWNGPGNFTSVDQNPAVTNPGTYTVVVTNLSNGCSSATSVAVTQDPTVPDIAVQADSLTCNTTSVVLQATTNTANVSFQWTGPNNFTSTLEDPTTSVPGAYTVTATAQSGCTATFGYNVFQNIVPPTLTAVGDTITCAEQSGQLSSQSPGQGVAFLWTGPNNFNSTLPNPTVNLTGQYTVVATAPNGCTSVTQVTVAPDVNAPILTVAGGTISCAINTLVLNATSNLPVSWQWSGPGNFISSLQQPTVTTPGNYTVSATAANGCVSSQVAVVLANTAPPAVQTEVPEVLDCTTTQVSLGASVTGSGQFIYQWNTTNGLILSGANSNAPQVSQAGQYNLIVTNQENGCSSTAQVVVLVDPATPSGAAIQLKNITCYGETDGLARIDSIQGGTPPFLFSLDNMPFGSTQNFTGLTPGSHSLQVQDANGCEYQTVFDIVEPEPFTVQLGPDTTIHLGNTVIITLEDITADPERIVQLNTIPSGLIFPDTLTPVYSFRYQVEVVDSNGCKARDDRFIIVDRERWVYIPNVFAPNSSTNNVVMVFGGEDVERVLSFRVFDRWGEALHEVTDFQPNDPDTGWGGQYKGQDLPPAVFVYYAEILFKDGETQVFKGDVTLIR